MIVPFFSARVARIFSLLPAPALALALAAACSQGVEETGSRKSPIRMALPAASAAPAGAAMPALINPDGGAWHYDPAARQARFTDGAGEPLLSLSCRAGIVTATRHAASDPGARALLAFVGSGILRLPVESSGPQWEGSLSADNPRWKALTGGPLYATVAGGGRLILPAMGPAADIIRQCQASRPATSPTSAVQGKPMEHRPRQVSRLLPEG